MPPLEAAHDATSGNAERQPVDCSAGRRSSAVLFRGLFTTRLTWCAFIGGGSLASSIAIASSGSAASCPSALPPVSYTGMRSLTSADTRLLSPDHGAQGIRVEQGAGALPHAGCQQRPGCVNEPWVLLAILGADRPLAVPDMAQRLPHRDSAEETARRDPTQSCSEASQPALLRYRRVRPPTATVAYLILC